MRQVSLTARVVPQRHRARPDPENRHRVILVWLPKIGKEFRAKI
jgi:hypothetical protein